MAVIVPMFLKPAVAENCFCKHFTEFHANSTIQGVIGAATSQAGRRTDELTEERCFHLSHPLFT
jgi:hypothetical protein